MCTPRILWSIGILVSISGSSHAIDVTDNSSGGAAPQSLAQTIVDSSTGVTLVAGSAVTTINTGGGSGPASDIRAYGSFANGTTPAGTLLPASNQNANGTAAYAGGIATGEGVCLCTGVLEDEASAATTGRGSGVLGPNNGRDNTSSPSIHPGEIVTELNTPVDQDFVNATGLQGGGDATVLQFDVQLSSPGFVRVSFVFGSDEQPAWIDADLGVNDSAAIIVNGENIATTTKNSVVTPFKLFEFVDCGLPLFISNDIAPSPSQLVGSAHSVPGAPRYDIEFGGFTKLLTRETACPLAPGTYKVKFVVLR